jgi:hypothetical protein
VEPPDGPSRGDLLREPLGVCRADSETAEGRRMTKKDWISRAKRVLLGRTITGVEYMSAEERTELDWHRGPIMLRLDSGVWVYPSQDDEGNGAGSLFTNDELLPIIPSI